MVAATVLFYISLKISTAPYIIHTQSYSVVVVLFCMFICSHILLFLVCILLEESNSFSSVTCAEWPIKKVFVHVFSLLPYGCYFGVCVTYSVVGSTCDITMFSYYYEKYCRNCTPHSINQHRDFNCSREYIRKKQEGESISRWGFYYVPLRDCYVCNGRHQNNKNASTIGLGSSKIHTLMATTRYAGSSTDLAIYSSPYSESTTPQ